MGHKIPNFCCFDVVGCARAQAAHPVRTRDVYLVCIHLSLCVLCECVQRCLTAVCS